MKIKTLKSILLFIIGICFIAYSISQSFESGHSFLPTNWGAFKGHKDIGGIYFFVLGIACIAYGIFDPDAAWNNRKKEKI